MYGDDIFFHNILKCLFRIFSPNLLQTDIITRIPKTTTSFRDILIGGPEDFT